MRGGFFFVFFFLASCLHKKERKNNQTGRLKEKGEWQEQRNTTSTTSSFIPVSHSETVNVCVPQHCSCRLPSRQCSIHQEAPTSPRCICSTAAALQNTTIISNHQQVTHPPPCNGHFHRRRQRQVTQPPPSYGHFHRRR